ncbi:MAG: tetratricopeptide repeat protein [Verrucomicrobiota bacterium]
MHSFVLHPRNRIVRFGTEFSLCGRCWRKMCRQHYADFANANLLMLRAWAAMDTDLVTARGWATEAIQRNSALIMPYALRAQIAEKQQDLPQAIADWSALLRLEPDNVDGLIHRAECQSAQAAKVKSQNEAVALRGSVASDLQKARQLRPDIFNPPPTTPPATRPSLSPPPNPTDTPNPMVLFSLAQDLMKQEKWAEARKHLSEAIRLNPSLTGFLLARGLCSRSLKELDVALADYDKAITLDGQHSGAWHERGVIKVLKAYSIDDERLASGSPEKGKYCPQAVQWFNNALTDYRKGAELEHNASADLSVLELEIILDKYRDAVGTAAESWGRIQQPGYKIVCAWLGAIAYILAGKRQNHWQPFQDFLRQDRSRPFWEPEQIDGYLGRLQTEGCCPLDRLKNTREIHQLFLKHYSYP